ncbi:MAG TPA: R3H domain-containing nucleic acid-binding protein [Thermoanaerobaculia bacterium]|nr:R3H domain-containing nucleic acid-binding protein [Thermoanaerobaculia bacterium]
MNEPKRRFFSGDSLQQALVQAANHFHLDPEEIAYKSIEKKHGFIKVRRKVVIEVDPDAPRRERQEKPVAAPPATVATAPMAAAPAAARPEAPRDARPEERPVLDRPAPAGGERPPGPPRGERRERDGRGARGDRGDRRGPRRDDRGARPGRERSPREARERTPSSARTPWNSVEEPRRREPGILEAGGLVALPDAPRRVTERFPVAEGPQAEAALKAATLLLRVTGLDLAPRVLQGEDRLEVDLTGEDVDWCFADDGELVLAIEHLLPRLIRSLSGEPALVRVDCDNFQEIREERLRSLAQRMAEEVRRFGKPRTLEPMNPADRRIIHVTLADDPHVVTESEGDGFFKRVMIRPA